MTTPEERPLAATPDAADALRLAPHTLDSWADRGLLTPACTDPDGIHWWVMHDLRRELLACLESHPDDE